jgi:hypothetical protein
MRKLGYRFRIALGLAACAGAIGILSPQHGTGQRTAEASGQTANAPWVPLTTGPGPQGTLGEFARNGSPAPGGGVFVHGAQTSQPLPILVNQRGQMLFLLLGDWDKNGVIDGEGLYLANPNGIIQKIVRTDDLLPDGSVLMGFGGNFQTNRAEDHFVLTDSGQVYFSARVASTIPNYPPPIDARLGMGALYGWSGGRLFTIVGRNQNRTADGRYIAAFRKLVLLSPGRLCFRADFLPATGGPLVSRFDDVVAEQSFFVYQTP